MWELKTYKRTSKYGYKPGSCIIPKSYVEQIKMGLVIIEPCEIGLFTDCLARMCSLDELCEDKKFSISPIHQEPRNTLTKVLASGVAKVFVKDVSKTSFWRNVKSLDSFKKIVPVTLDNRLDLLKEFSDNEEIEFIDPIDFGSDPTNILRFLRDDEKESNQFSLEYVVNMGLEPLTVANEPNLLGYIPWKLFDIYYGIVEKEENFLEPHIDLVKKISTFFYDIEGLTYEEKYDLLNKLEL